MALSDSVYDLLISKHGFSQDTKSPMVTFKSLGNGNLALCFQKAGDDGGPYIGFWAENAADDEKARGMLAPILHEASGADSDKIQANESWIMVDCAELPKEKNTVDGIIAIFKKMEEIVQGIFDASDDDEEEEEVVVAEDDTEPEEDADAPVYAGSEPQSLSIRTNLPHALRIFFGNNYGVIPRRNEFGYFNWEGHTGKLHLFWRVLLICASLWIVADVVMLIGWIIPYARFFFIETPAVPVASFHDTPIESKAYTYSMIDPQGNTITQTIPAGTTVYPFSQYPGVVFVEDEKGNRPDSYQGYDGDPSRFPRLTRSDRVVYTDGDIEKFFVGKTLEEVEAQYTTPYPVIALPDGSKLAHLYGYSTRGENGRRQDELVVKTDTDGIIREYAFTGEAKYKAGLLDYIPKLSILEMAPVRRYIQNINGPWVAGHQITDFFDGIMDRFGSKASDEEKDESAENEKSTGSMAKIIALSILSAVFGIGFFVTLLVPPIIVPVFVSMLLFIHSPHFSTEKIIGIGTLFGCILYLPCALWWCLLIPDMVGQLMLIVPSLLVGLFVLIPRYRDELRVMRCDACAGWDSIFLVEEIDRTEYKETKTTKWSDGREEKEVSYRYLTRRKYQCRDCGNEFIYPSWK